MRQILTAISLLLSVAACAQFQGLIVNEFSQGDQGSREYIELLVTGTRTCTDTTADLRGWIVDDQNGWYGTASLTKGHYRFKNVSNWAAVPLGAIILLYNSAANNKNLSITLPDDPTDANKDLIYVVPINSAAYLEESDNEPSATTTPSYVYPPASATAGYSAASNLWIQHIALTNGSDVICTISPQDRTTHYFAIGFGYTIGPSFRSPSVSVAAVNGGENCFLTTSAYNSASSWSIAPVPASETPGLPNGGANNTWIQSMRTTPRAMHTFTTACSNGPFTFLNQTFGTTGLYTVLTANANGCADTSDLYVVVKRTETRDTAACDSVVYGGITYRSNAVVTERIKSLVLNCDSIERTVRITVKKSTASLTTTCVGPAQSFVFNGYTFTATGLYTVTLLNAAGCDSLASLYLLKTKLDSQTVQGCTSVVYNQQTYTTSTVLFDTVRSVVSGCDSIVHRVAILIKPSVSTSLSVCTTDGNPYLYNNTTLTTSGLYPFTFATPVCDSTVFLYIVFRKTLVNTITGCDSVLFRNRWYFATTAVNDTVRSTVTTCDSLLTINRIIINSSKRTSRMACVPLGGNYAFFNQSLTVSGLYAHTLQTTAGCDSVVQLNLTVASLQTQTIQGCDSVKYNNRTYFASTQLRDTLRNGAGCDSLVRVINIDVRRIPHTYLSACRGPGQTYFFNGQTLTASGNYQTTYNTATCDSVVHLSLLIAKRDTVRFQSCGSYVYNGTAYTASVNLTDTLKSRLTNCDSVLRTVFITIANLATTSVTVCIAQGQTYVFNGQPLSVGGHYTAHSLTQAGCDSTVHLYLTVTQKQTKFLEGCDSVVYNGVTFFGSAIVSDTVKSVVSFCDSLVRNTIITVHPKPLLTVSGDTTICRWGIATLQAFSPGATIVWYGTGPGNTVLVSPQGTTQYTVTAVDANGCANRKSLTVTVDDLLLRLTADKSQVLSGEPVWLQSRSNSSYIVQAWHPQMLFGSQTAKGQRLVADSSVNVTLIGQSTAGCKDTANLLVAVQPLSEVYIPSAFTPNGDGRNEEVKVMGTGISEVDFRIFNRWGQLVFYTTDKTKGWNGITSNKLQPAGVYVYAVKIKKASGRLLEKKGTVTLIR